MSGVGRMERGEGSGGVKQLVFSRRDVRRSDEQSWGIVTRGNKRVCRGLVDRRCEEGGMELARCQVAWGGVRRIIKSYDSVRLSKRGGLAAIRRPGCLSSDPKDLPQGATS